MHFLEYFAIIERDHTIQNPSSPEKIRLLADYCQVRHGLRVLDVGSGKGYLLCTWAKEWQIEGTGLEINPWFIAEARARAQEAGVTDRVAFIEGPALDFSPEPGGYDIVLCIGASFALQDFDHAIPWMLAALKPDGVLAIGEPFFHAPLPPEVAAKVDPELARLHDLAGTVAAFEEHGLSLDGFIAASLDGWDRYESPHWRAAREWARANPDHPDREEFLRRVRHDKEAYFQWQRQYLGWGIFVGRRASF